MNVKIKGECSDSSTPSSAVLHYACLGKGVRAASGRGSPIRGRRTADENGRSRGGELASYRTRTDVRLRGHFTELLALPRPRPPKLHLHPSRGSETLKKQSKCRGRRRDAAASSARLRATVCATPAATCTSAATTTATCTAPRRRLLQGCESSFRNGTECGTFH